MALTELLLYAVFAGFVLLFNLLRQWLSRRRGEQDEDGAALPPPQAGEDIAVPPRPVERVEEFWGRDVEPASAPVPAPEPATMVPGDLPPAGPARRQSPRVLGLMPARRRSARAHVKLGSKAELRQAIVTMTILQPCRALAPFDEDEGQGRR